MNDLMQPDRVIIGSANTPSGHRAAASLASVYASWVPGSRIVTLNIWSSELSKLVANSMLAQRISSINSISAICEKTGADIDEVSKSIGLDPRIGSKYLKAGIGFGGSCFKKDILSLVYLAESLGLEDVAEYWQQVLKINDFQRTRFVRRVIKALNGTLAGKKLAVLGYAFKKDTNDTRESPALESIKILLEDAPSEIAIFDPCCKPAVIRDEIKRLVGAHTLKENGGPIVVYSDAYQACMKSHAVVIMTDCDEFKNARTTTHKLSVNSKPTSADPRPFQRLEPTESEILSLHKFLSLNSGLRNPLRRYIEEPVCEAGCGGCSEEMGHAAGKTEAEPKADEVQGKENERLDWARIAYHLQKPKWLFDGRGIIDVQEMEALGMGVRVEGIGRVGWSGM
jgi:UDPglucose 6-dehydrogenase